MQFKETRIGKCHPDFDVIPLKQMVVDNIAGAWGDEPIDSSIGVVRSTNFNDTGYLDLADVAHRRLEDEVAEKLRLRENDILIERSGGSEIQPVGRVSFITGDVAAQNLAFANFIQRVATKPEIHPRYLFYCLYQLHSSGLTRIMQNQTNGIRNLEYRYYLKQLLPKPKYDEQKAIANVLTSVDNTIQATRRSIQGLERLRRSLMQHLLTGHMRPDGSWREDNDYYVDEKYGKVPVGWQVKFIGDTDVATINPNYEYEFNNSYDFLEMADIEENYKGVTKFEKIFVEQRVSGFTRHCLQFGIGLRDDFGT